MRIDSAYEEFLTYLAIERNCAVLTVEAYQSDGRVFLRYLAEEGVAAEVEAVDRQVLRRYVVWLRGRGLQATTIARRINSLRSFWKYLWDSEYTTSDPFRKLAMPKQDRKLPVYLSEDECRRLVEAAGDQRSQFLSCRDQAVLTFMLFTGARRSEVFNLRWEDIDTDRGTVRFVGAKGHKTRAVPLAGPAIAALTDWQAVRPECEHPYVFCTQWGARLAKRGLRSALNRALDAAGIDKPGTTPHKLRHSFACMMVHNGADLSCVQRLLGHTRLDTTGIYLEATAEDLREAMGRHPMANSQ